VVLIICGQFYERVKIEKFGLDSGIRTSEGKYREETGNLSC
jgi:hypothetical protein